MDSAMAYKLVSDWARAERQDTSGIERQADGDFNGLVAELGFEFNHTSRNLAVRGQVLANSSRMVQYKDVMQELERIARDEPERVFHAQFDLVLAPWDVGFNDNPTLYLRRDYRANNGSEAKLFEEWRKLREMAYLWHRTYLSKAVDPIVQRRLKQQ
jgi:hypothetical protein